MEASEVKNSIQLTDSGFKITSPHGSAKRIVWSEVRRIYAYKLDVFAYDILCLGFMTVDREPAEIPEWDIEVCEEDIGYRDLIAELHRRFGVSQDSWWKQVEYPAFATNLTQIWPT